MLEVTDLMQWRQSVDIGGVNISTTTKQPSHFLRVGAGTSRQKHATVVELDGGQLAIARRRTRAVRLRCIPASQLLFATPQRVFRLDKFLHYLQKHEPIPAAAAPLLADETSCNFCDTSGKRNAQTAKLHTTDTSTYIHHQQLHTSYWAKTDVTGCLHPAAMYLNTKRTGTCRFGYGEFETARVIEILRLRCLLQEKTFVSIFSNIYALSDNSKLVAANVY